MKSCPYFDSNNNLVLSECYTPTVNATGPGCTAYNAIITKDGNFSTGSVPNPYNGLYIGYETTAILNRVCLPSSAVLSNALKDYATQISTALQQGSFASLTKDVQNVTV